MIVVLVYFMLAADQLTGAQELPVFSGPQVGEPLPPLPVTLPLDANANEPIDAASKDDQHSARLIVFVHQITRPAIAFTRVLGEYANTRDTDGLATSVVFLGKDLTELSDAIRRAKGALPKNVLIGTSVDGLEGPGAYGLNRNMTLTIVLAKDGEVTFNAALVDPSLPVELPKVVQAICNAVGGNPPELESLTRTAPGMAQRASKEIPNEQVPGFTKVEPLVRRLIRKETSDEQVDQLATDIDKLLEDAPEAKQRLKEISGRVYKIYGSDRAKVHLRRWAGVDEDDSNEAESPPK